MHNSIKFSRADSCVKLFINYNVSETNSMSYKIQLCTELLLLLFPIPTLRIDSQMEARHREFLAGI
jgi:hypothetical protein